MAGPSATRHTDPATQRIQSGAFVVAAVLCGFLGLSFTASGSMSLGPPVVNEIDSFVNPNEATAASLVRLPGIGISKAAAIVSYREDFARAKTGGRAFGDVDELENVAGIGPKTAARLAEYLIFE